MSSLLIFNSGLHIIQIFIFTLPIIFKKATWSDNFLWRLIFASFIFDAILSVLSNDEFVPSSLNFLN